MKNLFTQNMIKKNIRVVKFLNLKTENEIKNKFFSIYIISIQYWCLFQTSKHFMHIVKKFLHVMANLPKEPQKIFKFFPIVAFCPTM
jgi:hypothetical protein